MPVKHDLPLDLGYSKEALDTLKGQDPRLTSLIESYTVTDKQVVEAEAPSVLGVSDVDLLKLKEKRLKIKDDIVSRLASQAAR